MLKITRPASLEREQLASLPVSGLVELILKQQELIEQLFEEIERLKEINRQDSKTSSKPPSSDLLQRSEKAPEPSEERLEGKRKAGGQPGHPGKTRKGFSRVDRYEILRPEVCPDCGSRDWTPESWEVKRQQVAQLRQNPIEVVEYQQTGCECAQCHARVIAPFPVDVVEGQDLGVSLQAMLSWLGVYGHLSYEKQQEWLHELGLEVSLGTLQRTTSRVAQSVQPAVEQLRAWVKTSPQVQADESPWLVGGVKEWMWVFVGVGFCLFHAGDTRSRKELETILGKYFAGVLSSDDYSVYNGYAAEHQQKCLAHLLRHFKRVHNLNQPSQQALSQVFIALIVEAFQRYRTWQTSKDRALYDTWAQGFKQRVAQAIQEWLPKAGYAAGILLRNLSSKAQQWWYFLDHPEVPPDNRLVGE